MERTKIGVLSLDNNCEEHLHLLHQCGAEVVEVKSSKEMEDIEGLIIFEEVKEIPTLLKDSIIEKAMKSMSILALASGVIAVAKNSLDSDYDSLKIMDITVNCSKNNRANLVKDLIIPAISERSIKAVFKNAPIIEKVAPNVGILYQFNNKNIVFVRQGNFLACSFSPELTGDIRIYQYFIQMVKDSRKSIDKIN